MTLPLRPLKIKGTAADFMQYEIDEARTAATATDSERYANLSKLSS